MTRCNLFAMIVIAIPAFLAAQGSPTPTYPSQQRMAADNENDLVQRREHRTESYNLPRRLADHQLMLAIDTALRNDYAVPANNIDVAVNGSTVRLKGEVNSILLRERAELITLGVRGVQFVENQIEVIPRAQTEEELAQMLRDALQNDPATGRYKINVEVNGTTAILTGNVNTWREKQLARQIAIAIPGIQEIDNRLESAMETSRSDDELYMDVMSNLRLASQIDPRFLQVDVDDGVVKVSGTVRSALSKQRVEELAHVAGVRAVNVDGLEVQWWLDDSVDAEALAWEEPQAEAVRATILRRIGENPRVAPFNVDVVVEEGDVYLMGEVDNLAAKMAASDAARATRGVYRVRNMLKVRPSTTVADTTISEYLNDRASSDYYLSNDRLAIESSGGVVTLTGTVDSDFEREYAEALASRVRGVVQVRNLVEVRRPADRREDWELRQDIQNALEWNPLIEANAIRVEVDDGRVTLSGRADQWSQRQLAQDVAYDAGAVSVRNEIRVPYGPMATTPGQEYSARREAEPQP